MWAPIISSLGNGGLVVSSFKVLRQQHCSEEPESWLNELQMPLGTFIYLNARRWGKGQTQCQQTSGMNVGHDWLGDAGDEDHALKPLRRSCCRLRSLLEPVDRGTPTTNSM